MDSDPSAFKMRISKVSMGSPSFQARNIWALKKIQEAAERVREKFIELHGSVSSPLPDLQGGPVLPGRALNIPEFNPGLERRSSGERFFLRPACVRLCAVPRIE
jgi:hypothetical protein